MNQTHNTMCYVAFFFCFSFLTRFVHEFRMANFKWRIANCKEERWTYPMQFALCICECGDRWMLGRKRARGGRWAEKGAQEEDGEANWITVQGPKTDNSTWPHILDSEKRCESCVPAAKLSQKLAKHSRKLAVAIFFREESPLFWCPCDSHKPETFIHH